MSIYDKTYLDMGSIGGEYVLTKNNIFIYNKNIIIDTLNHELSHSASSYFNKEQKKIYSGFSQFELKNKNYKDIGTGFNEFYTNVFSRRYFKSDRVTIDYDIMCSNIVELTEMIVGKTEMENYYLNGNLYGFIEDLMQYTDNNKYLIKKFLINTDYLYDLYCSEKQDLFTIRKIKKNVKEIYNFLSLCYLKKTYQNNGNIIYDDILDLDNSEFFLKYRIRLLYIIKNIYYIIMMKN